jgi:hypothetical protein
VAQADHATTTIPAPTARPAASRRTMLMGIAAAAALPVPAFTSALEGADPIYAAIAGQDEAAAAQDVLTRALAAADTLAAIFALRRRGSRSLRLPPRK